MAYPVFLFMVNTENKVGIKSLAIDERPREKMLLQGRRSLSDAELLAILIGSGSSRESAVELSQRILASQGNSLAELGLLSRAELTNFHGIGEAKAVTIMSALELGRRRKEEHIIRRPVISCSKDAFEIMDPVLSDLNHEEFWILMLNAGNRVINKSMISKGGRNGTVADPKIIFRTGLDHHAANIILFHNHPSGNLVPSTEDIRITEKLLEAGKTLELRVLDHLIIGAGSYVSLADDGYIKPQ